MSKRGDRFVDLKAFLKKTYTRVASSGFLKSVLTLSSGALVGQAINFLGMPLVGRVYSPAAMGDYTIITTNATVISSVACLGLMTAFMLPKKDEEARGLSRLATYSTVIVAAAIILGLWLLAPVYRIFQTEETSYGVSLLVLWLYILFNTISNICYAYVNRRKLYKVMFWNPIIECGANVICGIGFGLLGWGFVGYTAAHILAFGMKILHLVRHANPYERIEDPAFRCIPLLKSYKRFPVYQMPANLVANLGNQIPVQTMEAFFSSAALGMYSMALKILSLPTTLLATPINRVYFQEASQRYNRGEDIGEFSFKILETNIKIAILPVMALMVFGEWIFAIFLGEQWREAGTYAAVLGVYELMKFCTSCLSGDFVIIKKNAWNLVSSVATLVISLVLLVVCRLWAGLSPLGFLALLAAVMTLKIVVAQVAFFLYVKFPVGKYLLFVLKFILIPCAVAMGIRALF